MVIAGRCRRASISVKASAVALAPLSTGAASIRAVTSDGDSTDVAGRCRPTE
jgi:hypothetical protein